MRDLEHIHPKVFKLGPSNALPEEALSFPLGLGAKGVHEVCETQFGDLGALTGFVLAAAEIRRGAIAWISQYDMMTEHGRLMAAGQASLRREQRPVMSITARRSADALWALEETITSSSIALAIAEIGAVDFTASRRLQLASERTGTPVILILPYTTEGASAATARWRVRPEPSSPNRYDPRALGHTRWHAQLERSRIAPNMIGQGFKLELDNETLSLRVVSGLAAHAPAPGAVWDEAGAGAPYRETG